MNNTPQPCPTCGGKGFESEYECKVCAATPDEQGTIHHGKGCYVVDEDGGGDEPAPGCIACNRTGIAPTEPTKGNEDNFATPEKPKASDEFEAIVEDELSTAKPLGRQFDPISARMRIVAAHRASLEAAVEKAEQEAKAKEAKWWKLKVGTYLVFSDDTKRESILTDMDDRHAQFQHPTPEQSNGHTQA